LHSGQTHRTSTTTEAESYLRLALLAGHLPASFVRATTEDHALDSFQNLLFSIARFHEYTGRYPARITVIGYEMKRRRFTDLHRAAIRWPEERFDYIGVDPDGEERLLQAQQGEVGLSHHHPQKCLGLDAPLGRKKTVMFHILPTRTDAILCFSRSVVGVTRLRDIIRTTRLPRSSELCSIGVLVHQGEVVRLCSQAIFHGPVRPRAVSRCMDIATSTGVPHAVICHSIDIASSCRCSNNCRGNSKYKTHRRVSRHAHNYIQVENMHRGCIYNTYSLPDRIANARCVLSHSLFRPANRYRTCNTSKVNTTHFKTARGKLHKCVALGAGHQCDDLIFVELHKTHAIPSLSHCPCLLKFPLPERLGSDRLANRAERQRRSVLTLRYFMRSYVTNPTTIRAMAVIPPNTARPMGSTNIFLPGRVNVECVEDGEAASFSSAAAPVGTPTSAAFGSVVAVGDNGVVVGVATAGVGAIETTVD
jgi:hypothetical protein